MTACLLVKLTNMNVCGNQNKKTTLLVFFTYWPMAGAALGYCLPSKAWPDGLFWNTYSWVFESSKFAIWFTKFQNWAFRLDGQVWFSSMIDQKSSLYFELEGVYLLLALQGMARFFTGVAPWSLLVHNAQSLLVQQGTARLYWLVSPLVLALGHYL